MVLTRARMWIGEVLVRAGLTLIGVPAPASREVLDEDDENEVLYSDATMPAVAFTEKAQEMLHEGRTWRANFPPPPTHEKERVLRGSAVERFRQSRSRLMGG